jgi:hypothetical protein
MEEAPHPLTKLFILAIRFLEAIPMRDDVRASVDDVEGSAILGDPCMVTTNDEGEHVWIGVLTEYSPLPWWVVGIEILHTITEGVLQLIWIPYEDRRPTFVL